MNALAPYIAALHQQDLLEQAELLRRVKELPQRPTTVAAWRRGLGSGARRLSGLFAGAATRIDPSLCLDVIAGRREDGADAIAA